MQIEVVYRYSSCRPFITMTVFHIADIFAKVYVLLQVVIFDSHRYLEQLPAQHLLVQPRSIPVSK
jgi:hypothetical protein